MTTHSSRKVIYAALAGNFFIAITKFIASSITGSSAMLSEAIHSLVDTGNQGLMLYGLRRAARPADKKHPFGYSSEIYFWSFIVALLIFSLGSGISIYEGISKINHPHPMSDVYINYIILGFAIIFELTAWMIAFREFGKTRGNKGYFEAITRSKDPTIFTILFEDSAALLGLVVAIVGIMVAQVFDIPKADGYASIIIGILLAIVAMILVYETKGLLIGEAADENLIRNVRKIVNECNLILHINEVRSLHLGPSDILLALSLDFSDNITAKTVEANVSELEISIKDKYPQIKKLFIEVQSHAASIKAKEKYDELDDLAADK